MADHVSTSRWRGKLPGRLRGLLGSGRPPAVLALAFLASLITRCSGGASLTPLTPDADAGVLPVECDAPHVQTQCALPASVCDADGQTLIYYMTPTCVSGHCQWTRATQPCPYLGCSGGSCYPNGTGVPAPTPWPSTSDASMDAEVLAEAGATSDDASAETGSGDDGSVDSQTAPPPLATCVGEASTCALPASVCADSKHLLYFLNARCVDGACQSDVQSLACPDLCVNGGCVPLSITK